MEHDDINKKSLPVLLRIFRVIIVIAVASGIAFGLVALKKEPEKIQVEKAAPIVRVMTINPESKIMTVQGFGTVKPRKSVRIATEVGGKITYIHSSFIEGGKVSKEELLVKIDPDSYILERDAAKARLKQAMTDIDSLKQDIKNLEADLELARQNQELAKTDYERIQKLAKNQFASKSSLDKSRQQYLEAKMQLQTVSNNYQLSAPRMEQKQAALDSARVELQKAELALKRTRIRAGFNGFVIDKQVEIGEYVNPGQSLGVIYQKNALDVDVRIPVEKIKWIQPVFENGGMPAATIELASSGSSEPPVWSARVARLKASMDEQTRTLPMTIEIDPQKMSENPLFRLKPGTFVKCTIMGKTVDNLFVLPRHLIKTGQKVYAVEKDRLKLKTVSILRKIEDLVYINKGLLAGDQIIVSPLPGALEGMPLTIKKTIKKPIKKTIKKDEK